MARKYTVTFPTGNAAVLASNDDGQFTLECLDGGPETAADYFSRIQVPVQRGLAEHGVQLDTDLHNLRGTATFIHYVTPIEPPARLDEALDAYIEQLRGRYEGKAQFKVVDERRQPAEPDSLEHYLGSVLRSGIKADDVLREMRRRGFHDGDEPPMPTYA